jgi:hypothetical protein
MACPIALTFLNVKIVLNTTHTSYSGGIRLKDSAALRFSYAEVMY